MHKTCNNKIYMNKKTTGNEVSGTDRLVEDWQGQRKCVFTVTRPTLIFWPDPKFLVKNYIYIDFCLRSSNVFNCLRIIILTNMSEMSLLKYRNVL